MRAKCRVAGLRRHVADQVLPPSLVERHERIRLGRVHQVEDDRQEVAERKVNLVVSVESPGQVPADRSG